MALICRVCIKIINPANESAEPLSKYKDFRWNLLTGQILACFPDLDLRIIIRNPLVVCAKCAHIVREFSTLRMRVQETEELLLKYVEHERECSESGQKPKIGRGRGVDLAAVASMYESATNPLPILVKNDRFVQCQETGNVAVIQNDLSVTPLSTKHAYNIPSINKNISTENQFSQLEKLPLQLSITAPQIHVTNNERKACIEHTTKCTETNSVPSNAALNQIQVNYLDCIKDIEDTNMCAELDMSTRTEYICDENIIRTQKSEESLEILDNILQSVEVISESTLRKSNRRIATTHELKTIDKSFESTSIVDLYKTSDKIKATKRNVAKFSLESVSNVDLIIQSHSNKDKSMVCNLSVNPGSKPKKWKIIESSTSSSTHSVPTQTNHSKRSESIIRNKNCSEEETSTEEDCTNQSKEVSIRDTFEQNQSTLEENIEKPSNIESSCKISNVEQQSAICNDSVRIESSPNLLEIFKILPYKEPKQNLKKKLRGRRFLFNIPKKRQRKMPFITSVVSLASAASENGDLSQNSPAQNRLEDTQYTEQKINDEKCVFDVQEENSRGFSDCLNESAVNGVFNSESSDTQNTLNATKDPIYEEVPSNQQNLLNPDCLTRILTSDINDILNITKPTETDPTKQIIGDKTSSFHAAISEDLSNTLTSPDGLHVDSLQSKLPPQKEFYSSIPDINNSPKYHITRYGRKVKLAESSSSFARKRKLSAKVDDCANRTLSSESLSLPVSISFEGQMVFLEGLKLTLVSPHDSTVLSNVDNSVIKDETQAGGFTTISDNKELDLLANINKPTLRFDGEITGDDFKTCDKNHPNASVGENPIITADSCKTKNTKLKLEEIRCPALRTTQIHSNQNMQEENTDCKLKTNTSDTKSDVTLPYTSSIDTSSTILPVLNLDQTITADESKSEHISTKLNASCDSTIIPTRITSEYECSALSNNRTKIDCKHKTRSVRGFIRGPTEATNVTVGPLSRNLPLYINKDAISTALNDEVAVLTSKLEDNSKAKKNKTQSIVFTHEDLDVFSTTGSISIVDDVSVVTQEDNSKLRLLKVKLSNSLDISSSATTTIIDTPIIPVKQVAKEYSQRERKTKVKSSVLPNLVMDVHSIASLESIADESTAITKEGIKLDRVNLEQTRDICKRRKRNVKSVLSIDQDTTFTPVNTDSAFIDTVPESNFKQTNSPKIKGVKAKSNASSDVNEDFRSITAITSVIEISSPNIDKTVVKQDTSSRRRVKGKNIKPVVNICTADAQISPYEQSNKKNTSKAKGSKVKYTNKNKDTTFQASSHEQSADEENCKTKEMKTESISSLCLRKNEALNLRYSSKAEDLTSIDKLTLTADSYNSKRRRIKGKPVISVDINKDIPIIDTNTSINTIPMAKEHTNEGTIINTAKLIRPRFEFKKDISQNITTRSFIQDQLRITDPAIETNRSRSLEANLLRNKSLSSTVNSSGTIIVPELTSEYVVKEDKSLIRTANTSSKEGLCVKTLKTLTSINDTLLTSEAKYLNTKTCTSVDVSKDQLTSIADVIIDQSIAETNNTRKWNKRIDKYVDSVASIINTSCIKNSKAPSGMVKTKRASIATSSIADLSVVSIGSAVKTESSQILPPPSNTCKDIFLPKASDYETLKAISKDPTKEQFVINNQISSQSALDTPNETIDDDKFTKDTQINEIFIVISAKDQSLARAQLLYPSKERFLTIPSHSSPLRKFELSDDVQKELIKCRISTSFDKSIEDVNENLISDLEEFKSDITESRKVAPKCITSKRGICFQRGIDKNTSTLQDNVKENERSFSIFSEEVSKGDLIKIKHDNSEKNLNQLNTSALMSTIFSEPKINKSKDVLTHNNINSPITCSDFNGAKNDNNVVLEIFTNNNKSKELVVENKEAIITCQSKEITGEKPTDLSVVDVPKVVLKSPGRRKNKSPTKFLKSICKSNELKPDGVISPLVFPKQEPCLRTTRRKTSLLNELNTQEKNKDSLGKSSVKLDKVINSLKCFSTSEVTVVKEDHLTPVISCQKRNSLDEKSIQEHVTPTPDIKYKLSPKSEKTSTHISSDGKPRELTQDDIESVFICHVEESSKNTLCENEFEQESLTLDKMCQNKIVVSRQDAVISCLKSCSSIDTTIIENISQATQSLNVVESEEASLKRTPLNSEDPPLSAAEITSAPISLRIPSKCLINRKRKLKSSVAKNTDQSDLQNTSKDVFYKPKIKIRKIRRNKSKIKKTVATRKRTDKYTTCKKQPNTLANKPQEATQSSQGPNLRDCFLECVGKSSIDETIATTVSIPETSASCISQTLKEFWAEFNTSLESPGKSSQDQFIDSMCLPEVFAEVTLPYLDTETDLCVDSSNLENITPTLIAGPKVLTDVYLTMQDHCQENVKVSVTTQFDSDSFQEQVDGLNIEDILPNKIECHPSETTSSDNTTTNTEYITDMPPDNNAIYASTDYLSETEQNLMEPGTSKTLPKPIPVLLSISGKSGRQSIKIIKVPNTSNSANMQEQSTMDSCEMFPQTVTPTKKISCDYASIETTKQTFERNSTVFQLPNISLSPNSNLMLLVKPGDILESPRHAAINQQPSTICKSKSSPSKLLLSPEYKHKDINTPHRIVSHLGNDCYTVLPNNEPEYSNEISSSIVELPQIQKRRGRPARKTVCKTEEKTTKKMVHKPLKNEEDMVAKCTTQRVTRREQQSKIPSSITQVQSANDFSTECSNYLSKDSFQQVLRNPLNDLPSEVIVKPVKSKPLEMFTSVILKPESFPYTSVSVQSMNVKQIKFSCEICRFDFDTQSSLLNHKEWHYKWGGLHQCKYCAKRYDNFAELNSHTLIHGLYSCNNCNRQFGSRVSLHDHLLSNHGNRYLNVSTMLEPEVLCPDCGRMVTISVLPFHLDWHDPDMCIRCAICSRFVLRMDQHMHWNDHHHNNKQFVCAVCGEYYSTKQTLCWHLEKHSNKCRLCGVEMINVELKEHRCPKGHRRLYKRRKHQKMMATFRDKRTFKCKSCPMAYYFRDHLRVHAYRMHKECDQCGQVCFTEIVLQAHKIKVHEIDINAQFALCTRSYKSNKEIIEEAEEEMNRVRNATTANKAVLATKRLKKITCDICGRVFQSYSCLSAHRRFHKRNHHSKSNRQHLGHGPKHRNCIQSIDGKKGYVCRVCGRIFDSTSSRSSHIASHKGVTSSRKRSTYSQLTVRKEQPDKTSIIFTQDEPPPTLATHKLNSENSDNSVLISNIGESVEKAGKLTETSDNMADKQVHHFCQICDKSFKTLKQLTLHINIHNGIMSYNCTTCDKYFFTAGGLQDHELTCHKTPPPNPIVTITTADTNTSQSQSRSPRRTHACHCSEQFLSLATLRKHKALVHSTAPLPLPDDQAPAQ